MKKRFLLPLVPVILIGGMAALSLPASGTQKPGLSTQLATGSLWPWTAPADTRPSVGGATGWINGQADDASLAGKPTLLYFWTSSCESCLAGLPYLAAWERKYGSKGLRIVSVHAAEAERGRFAPDIATTIGDLGVRVPVALDEDFDVWDAAGVRAWPTTLLYGSDGALAASAVGTQGAEPIERAIQALLGIENPVSLGLDLEAFERDDEPETEIGYRKSSRYAGAGKLAKNVSATYAFPPSMLSNTWALEGEWKAADASVTLTGATGAFRFRASAPDVNVVMDSLDRNQILVDVSLDGAPVPEGQEGADLLRRGNGGTFAYVEYPKLHWLVNDAPAGEHVLELRFTRPGAIVSFVNFADKEETMK